MPRDAQVEQRLRIEIADRRAMGALHIVGEDLEFGLQVDLGALAEQQALGGLAAVGAVCAFRHADLALIDAARFAAGDVS